MNLRSTLDWITSWILLLLLTAFAAAGILFGSAGVNPSATLITVATCITGIAALLSPTDGSRPGAALLWAAMAASGFLVLLLMPDVHAAPGLGFRLAGGVLVLVLLITSLHSLIRSHTSSRTVSSMWLVLLIGLFFAAPLYLGPVAELASGRRIIVDSIIFASPISYFSAIADYDYLRSDWFYRHTPFGGLRFSYPAPGLMTIGYLVAAAALMTWNIFGLKLKRGERR